MSLESFMALSLVFRTTARQTDFNPFLAGRLEREYYTLHVEDRLRVHSVIDQRDHFDNPTKHMEKLSLEQRWEILHDFHKVKLLFDSNKLVRQINAGQQPPQTSYVKAIFEGRAPVFIALALGDVLREKADIFIRPSLQ